MKLDSCIVSLKIKYDLVGICQLRGWGEVLLIKTFLLKSRKTAHMEKINTGNSVNDYDITEVLLRN